MVIGGLRGALSMVLALSLPETFPSREQIVTTTFGVVVLSILLQGSATAIAAGRMVRRSRQASPLPSEIAHPT
jgi:CPA1 family monovalent cation:H+ antiporter